MTREMKMKYKTLCLIVAISIIMSILNCSSGDVAGTGTQVGNGIVSGIAVSDSLGTIIGNADVFLRDISFLADTSGAVEELYITKTDEYGYFVFDNIPEGDYAVEIRANDSILGMHRFTLPSNGYDAGKVQLRPSGSYFGVVDTSKIALGKHFYARVFGLNILAQVNRFGEFYYPRLPAGMQILHIEAADTNIGLVEIDTVWIKPGTADTSGTPYIFPESWARDSIVVEDIIAVNKLLLSVEDVASLDSNGRVEGLVFDSVNLIHLVPAITHITKLRKLVVTHNPEYVIVEPELSKLKELTYLDLSYNGIEFIHDPVSELQNLEYLSVDYNKLPIGLPLSQSVIQWLDDYSTNPNWRDTQTQ